jgi:hypothetical protein
MGDSPEIVISFKKLGRRFEKTGISGEFNQTGWNTRCRWAQTSMFLRHRPVVLGSLNEQDCRIQMWITG